MRRQPANQRTTEPPRATLAALLTLVASGCARDEGRWDDWRRACELEDGEHLAVPYDDEQTHAEISEACAERLGRDVGLDWDSFDAEPRAFSRAENAAEWVVAGLYVLASADLGTVGDLRADLVEGELLANEFEDYDALWAFQDDDPAARFWVAWLTHDRIASVANYPGEEDSLAEAFYGDVQIHGSTEALLSGDYRTPTGAMGILIHEGAHWTAPSHDVSTQTDQSYDGAYGVHVRILDSWYATYSNSLEAELVRSGLAYVCSEKIETIGAFPPCTRLPEGGEQ